MSDPMTGEMERELSGFLGQQSARRSECKFCGIPVTFRERIPYQNDGREHRCMSEAKARPCNRCQAPIKFSDRKPVNADGSPHRCIAESRSMSSGLRFDPKTGEIFGHVK